MEAGGVDFVQPNVNVTGGITEWLRVYHLATALEHTRLALELAAGADPHGRWAA